jgi:hypothetical protein
MSTINTEKVCGFFGRSKTRKELPSFWLWGIRLQSVTGRADLLQWNRLDAMV